MGHDAGEGGDSDLVSGAARSGKREEVFEVLGRGHHSRVSRVEVLRRGTTQCFVVDFFAKTNDLTCPLYEKCDRDV